MHLSLRRSGQACKKGRAYEDCGFRPPGELPLLCCITNGYEGLLTERVLRAIAEAGYRTAELHANNEPPARYVPERMDAAAVREALAQLNAYGLTPVSVARHSDFSTPAGIAALKTRIRFAVAVGAWFVTTATGHTDLYRCPTPAPGTSADQ